MALIDCIVGMSAEQYYATSNYQAKHSKVPFILFCSLSASSLAYLIIGTIAVQYKSVRDIFVMGEDEAAVFLDQHLKGSNNYIDSRSVIVFRSDIPVKEFAVGFTLFVSFVFCRYIIAIAFLIMKATRTQVLNNNQVVSLLFAFY
uniref:Uncharacterized protein n=1 Tax=Panagrolaimus sp. PS1159 TaxID=55785 RepID=A0AC35GQ38_9BILA